MIKKYIIFSVLAVIFTANIGLAQDNDLKIYPLPAVFTSKQVDIHNPQFKALLEKERKTWVDYYVKSVKKNFQSADTELSDKNKYKTFAAYVNIPRVSQHVLDKGALTDIYLPMTMSINFVNMATSETLYSYPFTYYAKYETTKEKLTDKAYSQSVIAELYTDTYKNLTDNIVQKAAEEFKPFSIDTNIIDSYRSLYILDKGLTSGIAKGDLLSDEDENQISVIYSSLDYAVAQILLGKASSKPFHKFANSSLAQLKKPKVLFINDFDDDKLYNIFSSSLGANADFSLMNVDKTFYDMQSALVSLNMNFKNKNVYNREVPDYFLKLYFTPPLYTQYPSGQSYLNTDRYSMIACGVIFDKTGKVVFSKCENEELMEQVVSGIRFNDEAKKEILAKNALSKLANSFAAEVKFQNTEFKITKTYGEYIFLADKTGLLNVNNTITIFKKISTEKKGTEITIPTWEYKIINVNNGVVECKPMFPLVDGLNYPSKNDKAVMTLASRGAGINLFNFYTDKMMLEGSDVELKFFKDIVFAAISGATKFPLSVEKSDFAEQIKTLNEGYGFKKLMQVPEYSSNFRIKPVYRIKLLEEKRKNNLIERKYEVIVGLVSFDGENILKKDGLKQEIIIAIPPNDNKVVQYELLKAIYPLFQQIANKF